MKSIKQQANGVSSMTTVAVCTQISVHAGAGLVDSAEPLIAARHFHTAAAGTGPFSIHPPHLVNGPSGFGLQ